MFNLLPVKRQMFSHNIQKVSAYLNLSVGEKFGRKEKLCKVTFLLQVVKT